MNPTISDSRRRNCTLSKDCGALVPVEVVDWAIQPKSNFKDIIVPEEKLKKIRIIPVETIEEVLKEALDWKGKEKILNLIMKNK